MNKCKICGEYCQYDNLICDECRDGEEPKECSWCGSTFKGNGDTCVSCDMEANLLENPNDIS